MNFSKLPIYTTSLIAAFLFSAELAIAQPSPPTYREIEILSVPFSSQEQALVQVDRLRELWDATHDRRAVFATVYSLIIEDLALAQKQGVFEDGQWVGNLAVLFADLYRQALLGYVQGATIPPAWQYAFDCGATQSTLILQDVLLGMNAHINRDLIYALAQIGTRDEPDLRSRDYARVNEVLIAAIDRILDRLANHYAPGLGPRQLLIRTSIEISAAGLVTAIRNVTFFRAQQLQTLKGLALQGLRKEIDLESIAFGRTVMAPQFLPGVAEWLRRREQKPFQNTESRAPAN